MARPHDTSGGRSTLGVAAGVAVLVLLLAADLIRQGNHVPVGLFVVAPLLTAVLATALPTAAVAVVAVVIALLVGLADTLVTSELMWRWTTVVFGGLLAVLLADQRRRWVEDIDVRRRTELLAATERLVRSLEDAQRVGGLGSWEHDIATDEVRWSEGMARLVGADPGSVSSAAEAGAHVAPVDRERLTALYRAALSNGQPFEYSQRLVHRDGRELLTLVVGEGVWDDQGTLVGLRGITRDVTDERRTAERLDQMRSQLVASHEVVDALQRSMLPQSLPSDPRIEIFAVYRSVDERAEIGGDWYDAFSVDEDELGLTIGDVAGHGLEATTLMAHARLALRWEGFNGSEPGAGLARVDRMLETETRARTFATAVFGRYHLARGELSWSRAGHCPPIVWTSAGAVSVETCGGPPLGAGLAPDRYEESVLVLQPGETIMLYTDGLVERRHRSFGVGLDRLLAVLEADRGTPLATLVASLPDLLSDEGPLEDDCCILALRRVG